MAEWYELREDPDPALRPLGGAVVSRHGRLSGALRGRLAPGSAKCVVLVADYGGVQVEVRVPESYGQYLQRPGP